MFAKRLRELREERGLGVRELAAILNMSHVAISYLVPPIIFSL
jgi:transcriptional regulator with XRE-family HTH domain